MLRARKLEAPAGIRRPGRGMDSLAPKKGAVESEGQATIRRYV